MVAYSDQSKGLLDRLPAGHPVGLADPEHPTGRLVAGEIVLGVALTKIAAADLLAAAGASGVAAVVLRAPEDAGLVELAASAGVELHWLPEHGSWHELHRALTGRLSPSAPVRGDDELADLAQTIATLTGGLVTIEDTSARVLAYSRSTDEVDELRRLSILGRGGPPAYLALLREWGVYDRLAAAEEVVEIAEHPESGVRRRLAVGVFAGDRQLGTIWVQQGTADFGRHARQALLGAARLTAAQLVSQQPRAGRRATGDGLGALLFGRPGPRPEFGRDADRPCAVAVFGLGSTADTDPATRMLRLDELAAISTVHATAFRRNSITDQIDGKVYVLLPNLESGDPALGMVGEVVEAVRGHLDPAARGALGSLASSPAGADRSARAADQALAASTDPAVSFELIRHRLIAELAEDCLAQQPELFDERIEKLLSGDLDSARTLLGYLDSGSEVARVAADLGIHPTTVRYRLRRAVGSLELDLSDADHRLSTQLQLRCGLRARAKER